MLSYMCIYHQDIPSKTNFEYHIGYLYYEMVSAPNN